MCYLEGEELDEYAELRFKERRTPLESDSDFRRRLAGPPPVGGWIWTEIEPGFVSRVVVSVDPTDPAELAKLREAWLAWR